jgi:hypothetical protein
MNLRGTTQSVGAPGTFFIKSRSGQSEERKKKVFFFFKKKQKELDTN